ncbi:MAG: hypothetical protein KI788_09975 [Mameliella sp.]|nr:hypothetical protein [Mameliella sp.]
MQMTPQWSLMMVAVFLVMGVSNWRRRRLKRAARDLPTRLFRQLGPEPEFDLPDSPPEGLEDFAALQKRSLRVQHWVWGLALLWLVYVIYLAMGATQ